MFYWLKFFKRKLLKKSKATGMKWWKCYWNLQIGSWNTACNSWINAHDQASKLKCENPFKAKTLVLWQFLLACKISLTHAWERMKCAQFNLLPRTGISALTASFIVMASKIKDPAVSHDSIWLHKCERLIMTAYHLG